MTHTRALTTKKGKQNSGLEKGLCSVVRGGTDRRYILASAQNAQTLCTLQVVPHAASARYASEVQIWHTGTDMNRDKISESFAESRDCSTPDGQNLVLICVVVMSEIGCRGEGLFNPNGRLAFSDLCCRYVCLMWEGLRVSEHGCKKRTHLHTHTHAQEGRQTQRMCESKY